MSSSKSGQALIFDEVAAESGNGTDAVTAGSSPALKQDADSPPADAIDAFVRDWARDFPYNRFRNYPLIDADAARRLLVAEVLEGGTDVSHVWHRNGAELLGLVRIVEQCWDSALYGFRMGRVSNVCGELDPRTLRRLLENAAFDHLAIRVDASDTKTQRLLTEAGFFPADTILTYLYNRNNGEPPSSPVSVHSGRHAYRPFRPEDRDSILRITSRCYSRYPGRYQADPLLKPLSAERYLQWARKYVDGVADQICVSEMQGRVSGYVAFRYDRNLYDTLGIGSYGTGLGASRGGDYHDLLRYTLWCDKEIDWQFAECDTQIDNYHVHRIYRDLKLDYVRAEHTYHLHLV